MKRAAAVKEPSCKERSRVSPSSKPERHEARPAEVEAKRATCEHSVFHSRASRAASAAGPRCG
jgi:hypothetical protein